MQRNDDFQRWDYLRHQIATASIHGLPKVFTSQFSISKTTWLVVFLCASAGCCVHGYMLLKNYFDYPTKVQITLKSAERQIFPSVTVCNLNPAYWSKLLCINYELAAVDEHMPEYLLNKSMNATAKIPIIGKLNRSGNCNTSNPVTFASSEIASTAASLLRLRRSGECDVPDAERRACSATSMTACFQDSCCWSYYSPYCYRSKAITTTSTTTTSTTTSKTTASTTTTMTTTTKGQQTQAQPGLAPLPAPGPEPSEPDTVDPAPATTMAAPAQPNSTDATDNNKSDRDAQRQDDPPRPPPNANKFGGPFALPDGAVKDNDVAAGKQASGNEASQSNLPNKQNPQQLVPSTNSDQDAHGSPIIVVSDEAAPEAPSSSNAKQPQTEDEKQPKQALPVAEEEPTSPIAEEKDTQLFVTEEPSAAKSEQVSGPSKVVEKPTQNPSESSEPNRITAAPTKAQSEAQKISLQTLTKSSKQDTQNVEEKSTKQAVSHNSKEDTKSATEKPTEKQIANAPNVAAPVESPPINEKETKAVTKAADSKEPQKSSQAIQQSPGTTKKPESNMPEKASDPSKSAHSKDEPAEKSQEKQAPESPSSKEGSVGKTNDAAGNSELSPQAKEAVKRALQKMSSADSSSAKMIVDKLLQPSQPRDGVSAKDRISAALLQNAAFKDNFGSMMNAAKYKSQLVRNIQENGLNIFQAAVRSLQTQDLSDVHDLIYFSEEEIAKVGVPIEELVQECTYNGVNCNLTKDFRKTYNQKFGNCYTFNSGLDGRQVKTQLRLGSQTGLRLTLNIESNEYFGVLASEYGARVTIHAPGELSYPESDGFNVGTGRISEIGIRYREQYRLRAPYDSNCSANFPQEYIDQHLISSNIKYTLTTCKMACTDYHLKQICGCVQHRPEIKTVPQCYVLDEDQAWCRIDVLSKLRGFNASDTLDCPCTAPCYERVYDAQIASTHWPTHGHKQMRIDNYWKANSIAAKLIDDLKNGEISLARKYEFSEDKNLLRIHVYFLDLNYERIEEQPEYEFTALMADIGGILGLYIGMSVLSVGEIIEIIFTWYYIKSTIIKERRKIDENQSKFMYYANHPKIITKTKLQ